MVYRPTVRMDDVFKEYVELIYQATPMNVDRNVIIRLMMFTAPHSALFRSKVETLLKAGQTFPAPLWEVRDSQLWRIAEYFGSLNMSEDTGTGLSGMNERTPMDSLVKIKLGASSIASLEIGERMRV